MGFGKQKGKGAFQALLNLGGRKQVDLPNVIRPITIQSIWMNRPIYVNTLFSIEVGQKGWVHCHDSAFGTKVSCPMGVYS